MKDNRYKFIRHGSFGKIGVNRLCLRQSPASGIFSVEYYEKTTGIKRTMSLRTADLEEAKGFIQTLLEELAQQPRHIVERGATVLYVMRRPGKDGAMKIGVTKNLKQRQQQLEAQYHCQLKVVRAYRLADVEKAIHAELEQFERLDGEWFPGDLLPLVDKFFKVPKEIRDRRRALKGP